MREHDDERATAGYCGLSVATLRKRRRLGLPPTFIRVGRRVLYARADVDSFLFERRVVPISAVQPKLDQHATSDDAGGQTGGTG